MAVVVHPGREQHDRVDHAVTFTDLHRQRVGGHERERAGITNGSVAEVLDDGIQVGGHARDLGLRQAVDAEGLDQLVHAARGHASEVAVGHDRDQRGLRTLAALQEPLGEVGALAELGIATSMVPTRVSRSRCR